MRKISTKGNGAHSVVKVSAKKNLILLNRKFFDLCGVRLTRNAPFANSMRTLDPVAHHVIEGVKDRTMTDDNRLYNVIIAARYVSENNIEGDVVECGVWRGGSMMAIASTLLAMSDTSRQLYLYDTFEGMTKPSKLDIRFDGRSAFDLMNDRSGPRSEEFEAGVVAFASLLDVKTGMLSTGYPVESIFYEVGKVEDTLKSSAHKSLSIVRLDTDWYESTKHELEILWPKLNKGGVLIVDDYDHWTGARKAVDEYFATFEAKPLFMAMNSGRIIVKS
jgi:O-methyltransferase